MAGCAALSRPTLARDLALLQDRYAILTVQPFDLFPHTAHIECLVHLERCCDSSA